MATGRLHSQGADLPASTQGTARPPLFSESRLVKEGGLGFLWPPGLGCELARAVWHKSEPPVPPLGAGCGSQESGSSGILSLRGSRPQTDFLLEEPAGWASGGRDAQDLVGLELRGMEEPEEERVCGLTCSPGTGARPLSRG